MEPIIELSPAEATQILHTMRSIQMEPGLEIENALAGALLQAADTMEMALHQAGALGIAPGESTGEYADDDEVDRGGVFL